MRVSLRVEKAVDTLEWVRHLELASGGIAAREGDAAYPEVSGYLIPTLFDYGERELALRIADWLVSIQSDLGWFPDMQGNPRTFDTAACMEGLERAYRETWMQFKYSQAAERAREWIYTQIMEDGRIATGPGNGTALYMWRVAGLINHRPGQAQGLPLRGEGGRERVHYWAYALEGLWRLGETGLVREELAQADSLRNSDGFMPFWTDGSGMDTCATCQMAILLHRAGMDASDLARAVERMKAPDGGLYLTPGPSPKGEGGGEKNSWTAKWYLDMLMELGTV